MVIESDADMPAILNTKTKQISKARALAQAHFGTKPSKVQTCSIQGFFSRTVFVTMSGSRKIVIQFRVEPLDIDYFKKARKALGEVVPDIDSLPDTRLEAEGVWSYLMTFVPGKIWLEAEAGKPQVNLTAACSLGRILCKGIVEGTSSDVVERIIKPRLRKIKEWNTQAVKPFLADIQRLLVNADALKSLPLCTSHFDLNKVNILVQHDGVVSGIVDWELASDLPFGMALHRIHDIAGEFCLGVFEMPGNFEEVERGFWDATFDSVSTDIRKLLDVNLDAVQTSVHIGALFWALDQEDKEDEAINSENAAYKYLAKFLTYSLPAQRGSDPPYMI